MKTSVKELKMTLACWIWTIWTMLTTVVFVGHPVILPVSWNLATKRWIVLLSGTIFLPKSHLRCHCSRRTAFVAKYASTIFIGCCTVNRPIGSILVSKESPRSAVYTTWKLWKKIVKHSFEMESKIGRLFWTTLYFSFSTWTKIIIFYCLRVLPF